MQKDWKSYLDSFKLFYSGLYLFPTYESYPFQSSQLPSIVGESYSFQQNLTLSHTASLNSHKISESSESHLSSPSSHTILNSEYVARSFVGLCDWMKQYNTATCAPWLFMDTTCGWLKKFEWLLSYTVRITIEHYTTLTVLGLQNGSYWQRSSGFNCDFSFGLCLQKDVCKPNSKYKVFHILILMG